MIYVNEDSAEEVWGYITNVLNNPKILAEYSDRAIRMASRYQVNIVAKQQYELILEKITGEGAQNEA